MDHDLIQAGIYGPEFDDDRSLMWLKARQDNKGQYLNESIIEIAAKIVSDFSSKSAVEMCIEICINIFSFLFSLIIIL